MTGVTLGKTNETRDYSTVPVVKRRVELFWQSPFWLMYIKFSIVLIIQTPGAKLGGETLGFFCP